MKNLTIITAPFFLAAFGAASCSKQPPVIHTDTVVVAVHDTAIRTLTVKPGPDDGQDCLVFSAGPDGSQHANPDFTAAEWTYNAVGLGEGTLRAYIEFAALDGLPDSIEIKSATLSLYGLNPNTGVAIVQGNSDYPGSPYGSPGNACWLKRVVGNWNQDSITWNNKPATSDVDEAVIPESTSQWNYNATIDVTKLVQDIVNSGQNFGFCMQMQTEQIYRSMCFAGSRNADSTLWPRLQVTYTIH